MTQVTLNGFFPRDYVPAGRVTGQVSQSLAGTPAVRVEIGDGRALQAGAESEAAFFAEHGFVLLPHATAVRDWDSDVATLYLPEIEAIVRERLLPGRRVEVHQQPSLLRRGRDTPIPFYAESVHSDFGQTAEDFATSVTAFAGEAAGAGWRRGYARDEVAGFLDIDFWRPTNMREPLWHMPLALCDPGSVAAGDVIDIALTGIAPGGAVTHHLSLREGDGQRWYSYPAMTGDELLAFKLFECGKDDAEPRLRSVFHSAFRHPDTPDDAEARQSCEHRVGVTVFRT